MFRVSMTWARICIWSPIEAKTHAFTMIVYSSNIRFSTNFSFSNNNTRCFWRYSSTKIAAMYVVETFFSHRFTSFLNTYNNHTYTYRTNERMNERKEKWIKKKNAFVEFKSNLIPYDVIALLRTTSHLPVYPINLKSTPRYNATGFVVGIG